MDMKTRRPWTKGWKQLREHEGAERRDHGDEAVAQESKCTANRRGQGQAVKRECCIEKQHILAYFVLK